MPSVRLAVALRYFASGSPYDIAPLYGLSITEAQDSIWYVVDAISMCLSFKMVYPDDSVTQQSIADGFKARSDAAFDCCAGAIDGILIWIHKPTRSECKEVKVDEGKFFCGREHKFGLNCQAVCDAERRFLDVSITLPASSADCLAFENSDLFTRLQEGLLAPGLCLFGDNAYINTPYMATPYVGAGTGTKDDYNFYHSQVRINIECAFGVLVHRWGILRSIMPPNLTIARIMSLPLS